MKEVFKYIKAEDFNVCSIELPLNLGDEKIINILLEMKEKLKAVEDIVKIKIYNDDLELKDLTEADIQKELKLNDFENEIIEISIKKLNLKNPLSIYSLECFSTHIKKLNLDDVIQVFYNYFNKHSIIYFKLINEKNINFNSNRIYFTSDDIKEIKNYDENNISYIFGEKNELCNIYFKNLNVLPNDFFLINKSENLTYIETIFNKITNVLCILAIANMSFFEKNILDYQINGYKTIKGKIDLKEKNLELLDPNILYNVYSWIYKNDTSILERMEISRNIFTLYSKSNDLSDLKSSILYSIKSTYEIYLQKNVDRYIKVLGEISILLDELENKFIITKEEFKNKFKNTLMTFFTFIFSTLLFNTLSTGKIENIFTKDITILSIVLIIFSIIYFYLSIKELENNLNEMQKSYIRKQEYFNVILNKEDINLIFSRNNFLKGIEEDVKKLKSFYIKLEMFILFIIMITLFFLVDKDIIESILENLNILFEKSNYK